jgi:hypothetical protein
MKIEGLPVIDVDESEEISVAVRVDDLTLSGTPSPLPYVGKMTLMTHA